jgi:hypothetical protein
MPERPDLVAGHFALSTINKAYPHAQLITILREPVSRLLSLWLYWRQHSDQALAPWGEGASLAKLSRQPLERFLNERILGPQTDNVVLRMLLWPHPLIARDDFIKPTHDRRLLREANARLARFSFTDVVEDDALSQHIERWLGRSFLYLRLNETLRTPPQWQAELHRELTKQAHDLLHCRSRLDAYLWAKVAAQRLVDQSIQKLQQRTILMNVARYSLLLAAGD